MMPSRTTKILVVVSQFYPDIASELYDNCQKVLQGKEIEVIKVPGCLEIPQAIAIYISKHGVPAGIVALGCVIKGETSHYDMVCSETMRYLTKISIKHCIPLGNGIITALTDAQARERSSSSKNGKNIGKLAAETLLHMMQI